VSAVLPIPSEGATRLLAGELGCGFCSLTPPPVGALFHSQGSRSHKIGHALAVDLSGELGCDFRHLCSPLRCPNTCSAKEEENPCGGPGLFS